MTLATAAARLPASLPVIACAMTLLAIGVPCAAQTGLSAAPLSSSPTFYLQAGVGRSAQTSGRYDRIDDDRDHGGSATGYKLGGGVQFTPRWGAELGYYHLGSIETSTRFNRVDYDTWVGSLTGTGTWTFWQKLSLVGKLGGGYLNSDFNAPNTGVSGTTSKWRLMGGLGLRYAVAPQLDVTLDYDYLGSFKGYQTRDDVGIGMLSAGLRFRF